MNILGEGFNKRRENHFTLGYSQINSHIVFNLNFILRDKENYNFPSLNSTIQFVEVCNPEPVSTTLKDDSKFQDSLCLNSQIATLQKVIYGIYTTKKV